MSATQKCRLLKKYSKSYITTCPAYMGAMPAVLARLLVLARPVQNMPKCRRMAECRRPLTFWPFFLRIFAGL